MRFVYHETPLAFPFDESYIFVENFGRRTVDVGTLNNTNFSELQGK